MPWPLMAELMLTAPLLLASALFCWMWLPVTLPALNADPAPPVAFVVTTVVLVFVVV